MNKKISLEIEGPEDHQRCVVCINVDFDSDPDLCVFDFVSIEGNYLPDKWEVTSALWKHFNTPERKD